MKKVLVGLSGGVDSATTALLLKQAGYQVTGVTFQFHQNEEGFAAALSDTKKVASKLGISHYAYDGREEFKKQVLDYFAQSYLSGLTPNPCPRCNLFMKFKVILEEADRQGMDFIATGHYAWIQETPAGFRLFQIPGNPKSQEYFLALLGPEVLNRLLLPLWHYKKEDVRALAQEAGLPVSSKKDSQEICFIPDDDYVKFIREYKKIEPVPGNLRTVDGKIVGRHQGFFRYTIGQRRGIGVGLGKPQYVIALKPEQNEVIIGDKELVEKKHIEVTLDREWENLKIGRELQVKIRYKSPAEPCRIIERTGNRCLVEANGFFGAPTPGQLAVFYDDSGMVLGAGDISVPIEK